jgi:hypothetical protein
MRKYLLLFLAVTTFGTFGQSIGQVLKPEEPAQSPELQRYEEEIGLPNYKLLDEIYKSASTQGIDAVSDLVQKHFTSRQKRIIKSLNSEGYVVLKPINPDFYEEKDLKSDSIYSEDFEPFKEFKMYRMYMSDANIISTTETLKNLIESQSISKKECKGIIENYYEIGRIGDVDMTDAQVKSAARQVYRCRRQHEYRTRINDMLDEIGSSRWSQDPDSGRFTIDYNNGTVGNSDSGVIDLK